MKNAANDFAAFLLCFRWYLAPDWLLASDAKENNLASGR